MWKFTRATKTSKNSTGKSTHRKFAAIHGLVWTFKVEAGFSLTECWTGNESEEKNSKKLHFLGFGFSVVSAFLLERLISKDSCGGIHYIYPLCLSHICVTFKEVRTNVTFNKTRCDFWKISSYLRYMLFL